jgi:hypothetical protein
MHHLLGLQHKAVSPVPEVEKAAKHPIAGIAYPGTNLVMLKRARISMALATVPAALWYTRLIGFLIPSARFLCWALVGFSIVSFLLAMFEDEPVPQIVAKPTALPAPQPSPLALAHAGHSG